MTKCIIKMILSEERLFEHQGTLSKASDKNAFRESTYVSASTYLSSAATGDVKDQSPRDCIKILVVDLKQLLFPLSPPSKRAGLPVACLVAELMYKEPQLCRWMYQIKAAQCMG